MAIDSSNKKQFTECRQARPTVLWSSAPAAALPLLSSGWAEDFEADLYLLTSLSSPARPRLSLAVTFTVRTCQ
jgi:hypothetical protein